MANQAESIRAATAQRITDTQVLALAAMLEEPARYTQRLVEQLTYLPRGGHRWTRSLQIEIPGERDETAPAMRVVSLGTFKRRRLADIEVIDESGRRVNLLTRQQHGTVLTHTFLASHLELLVPALTTALAPLPPGSSLEDRTRRNRLRGAYARLREQMQELITNIDQHAALQGAASTIGDRYSRLLELTDIDDADKIDLIARFVADSVMLLDSTHYLCWVQATPGDVVNLQVTYTSADRRREVDDPTANMSDPLDPDRTAQQPERVRLLRRWLAGIVDAFRAPADGSPRRMNWYRQYGLAPLNYGFMSPSREHVGSYYFTLEPAPRTTVTHLSSDEQTSLTVGDGKLDCSLPGIHFHNGTASVGAQPRGSSIQAYLRPDMREHKMIVGAALVNLAFVALIGLGRLSSEVDAANQAWVLLTPTLLTGFLAQQQRHYHALNTRRQRGVLWVYLAVSVLFLVAVSFSLAQQAGSSGDWGLLVMLSALLLAVSSMFILVCYACLGYQYEKTTSRWANESSTQPPWTNYERAVLTYGNRVLYWAVGLSVATIAVFVLVWSSGAATHRLRLTDVMFAPAATSSPADGHASASFTLHRPAVVTLTAVAKDAGVQVDGDCVAPRPRANPALQPCDLLVRRRAQALDKGPHTLRVGVKHPLPSGRYRLTLSARSSHTTARHVVERSIRHAPPPPRKHHH